MIIKWRGILNCEEEKKKKRREEEEKENILVDNAPSQNDVQSAHSRRRKWKWKHRRQPRVPREEYKWFFTETLVNIDKHMPMRHSHNEIGCIGPLEPQ